MLEADDEEIEEGGCLRFTAGNEGGCCPAAAKGSFSDLLFNCSSDATVVSSRCPEVVEVTGLLPPSMMIEEPSTDPDGQVFSEAAAEETARFELFCDPEVEEQEIKGAAEDVTEGVWIDCDSEDDEEDERGGGG